MQVFVLFYNADREEDTNSCILGVYSTREKAEAAKRGILQTIDDLGDSEWAVGHAQKYAIEEYTLDADA